MAEQKRPIFEQDDDDSVATDSTLESVEEAEYEVEKILLEQYDQETEEMKYLVKWVGYPLHRATFEVAENFMSDEILEEWEHQKRLIEHGETRCFDIQDFVDVYSLHQERKDQRRMRRDAKREQRRRHALAAFQPLGTTGEQDGGDCDHDDDENSVSSSSPKTNTKECSSGSGRRRRTRMKRHAPKLRKGMARPVPRRLVVSSSDESSGEELEEEEGEEWEEKEEGQSGPLKDAIADSMFENIHDRGPVNQKSSKKKLPSPTINRIDPTIPSKPDMTSGTSSSSVQKMPAASMSTSVGRSCLDTGEATKLGPKRAVQIAKRSSVPSVMANWEADRKRKRTTRLEVRPSTNANTPLFHNMTYSNIVQKYTRNEPAPDINSLVMIDPKTGKPESAKAKMNPVGPTPDIPSEYRRRTPPRPQHTEHIGLSPSRDQDVERQHPSADPQGPYDTKPITCHYWHTGYCRKPEHECSFAHYDTGVYAANPNPKAEVHAANSKRTHSRGTCWFWKNVGCKKSDSSCEFAHYDTGFMQQLPTKKITCGFWEKGRCTKTEETCQYAHRHTTMDGTEPAPSKKYGIVTDATSTSSVERNVAQRIDDIPERLLRQSPSLQTGTSRTGKSLLTPSLQASPTGNTGSLNSFKKSQTRHEGQAARLLPGRQNSVPDTMKDGVIHIQPEGATEPVTLKARFEPDELAPFVRLVGASLPIRVDCAIMAADVRVMIFEDPGSTHGMQASGDIILDPAFLAQADSLAFTCKLHSCGLMATLKEATSRMIIFPSNTEEWRFLEAKGKGQSVATTFRFRIFQCVQEFRALTEIPSTFSVPSINKARLDLLQQLDALDVKRFFHLDEKKGMDRVVFLMIPLERRDELDICVKFFSALKSKVYSSATPGAWSYVREHHHRSCLLIVHPEVPLWKVPGLYDLITLTGAGLRIFSMGVHKSLAILEDRPPRFECQRLFPHGTVYFITDEVFLYQPELATQLITQYLEQHKNKPEGGENDRIATRPGVKQWLLEVARSNTVGNDDRWVNLWSAICQLCPLEDEDPRDQSNLLPTSNLISMPLDTMPTFQALLKRKDDDEFAPTDWMVNWFAGWSLLHVTQFRRFIVCHLTKQVKTRSKVMMDENGRMYDCPEPVDVDPRGWAERYQHIGVARPESCIKRRK